MIVKKLFFHLIIMMLIVGCYNNPFLADTYKETFPSETQEKAYYLIRHYCQSKDLKSYELIDEKRAEDFCGTNAVCDDVLSYEGFIFDESNPENVQSGTVTADGSLVLKLYYNRNKYTVIFDKNSESAVGEMQPQIFYYGIDSKLILKKNSYSNGNFPFIGWASEPNATAAEFEDCSVLDFDLSAGSGELTLYALYGSTEVAAISKLTGKITGTDEDLTDGAIVRSSRNITVDFETNDYAVKGGWQLGDLTGDISDSSADFCDLKDGMYTFGIWCENKDGVKSEVKTFSWTIAADVKLNVSGIPNTIIRKDASINIDVSGDNLESCFYVLNDNAPVDIDLTNDAGKIFMIADEVGDFTLKITGKNILDETADENISWSVAERPIAKLSGVIDFMAVGTTQNITVSDCKYYMYKIKDSSDDSWSAVYSVDEEIAIENKADNGYSYTIDVIGGMTDTFSDDALLWQSETKPTSASWKVYPVYSGASLDSVLKPANKVSGSSGVSGKNIYATYDDNFVYFGYESQTTQRFSAGNNALCIVMKSSGAGNKTRYGIKPADHINEQEDASQPTFELNNEPVSHFLKISFDTDESGTAKFFSVDGGKWIESASAGIHFEVIKSGKCVIAVPRVLLASPNSELRYVIYMRCYSSGTIYAVYPKESDSRDSDDKPVYTSNIAVMEIK